jgi:hypothetical protein
MDGPALFKGTRVMTRAQQGDGEREICAQARGRWELTSIKRATIPTRGGREEEKKERQRIGGIEFGWLQFPEFPQKGELRDENSATIMELVGAIVVVRIVDYELGVKSEKGTFKCETGSYDSVVIRKLARTRMKYICFKPSLVSSLRQIDALTLVLETRNTKATQPWNRPKVSKAKLCCSVLSLLDLLALLGINLAHWESPQQAPNSTVTLHQAGIGFLGHSCRC